MMINIVIKQINIKLDFDRQISEAEINILIYDKA
jgi:hypothetical protein